ncbi:hypothetical protein BDR05DRAFT_896604 [Suillus weaverae]|nr:hypothetical protein BDR05DRAFT_896604 [Suillus weaverae]
MSATGYRHCSRYLTSAKFWAEFTTNGKWMKFTTIIQKLHEECVRVHAAIAKHACREYSDEFVDLFTYWKGGEEHLMTKPSVIAKRYEELANHHDDRTVV